MTPPLRAARRCEDNEGLRAQQRSRWRRLWLRLRLRLELRLVRHWGRLCMGTTARLLNRKHARIDQHLPGEEHVLVDKHAVGINRRRHHHRRRHLQRLRDGARSAALCTACERIAQKAQRMQHTGNITGLITARHQSTWKTKGRRYKAVMN